MHNLFRCSCGGRVVCGVGEIEYDMTWQELASDHSKMGHNILKPLKIPSEPVEAVYMKVNDEEADSAEEDNSFAYKGDELVA